MKILVTGAAGFIYSITKELHIMNIRRLLTINPRNPILKRLYIKKLQDRINAKNRKRLTNFSPTIVCSNCTGGFVYHWLGLQFNSPFINLFLRPRDFVTALENWDYFLNSKIEQVDIGTYYPVGQVNTMGG